MVITQSLLDQVAELERQRDVLVATIEASASLGVYHVFGASATHQLTELEYRLDALMFAALAVGEPLEAN